MSQNHDASSNRKLEQFLDRNKWIARCELLSFFDFSLFVADFLCSVFQFPRVRQKLPDPGEGRSFYGLKCVHLGTKLLKLFNVSPSFLTFYGQLSPTDRVATDFKLKMILYSSNQ
jgi:hypothetical protein